MPTQASSAFLLASPDPALLAALEPVLLAASGEVEIVLSAEAALAALDKSRPLALALLDATLTSLDPAMDINRLLAAIRAQEAGSRLPIVLISDTVTQDWIDRLAEGVIDDLVLRPAPAPYWRLRIEMALRGWHKERELQTLREAQVLNAQFDRLTGVYNRETILAMLFRETDRVQRMNSALSLLLLDIDDFGHWNSRLGNDACDELLCQVAAASRACCAATICSAVPARTNSCSCCPAAAPSTPSCSPSACAWTSSAHPSTWAAIPSASPPASALPPARAARPWWCCAKPNRPSNGLAPPARSPFSASETAPTPRTGQLHFYPLRPEANCSPGKQAWNPGAPSLDFETWDTSLIAERTPAPLSRSRPKSRSPPGQ